MSCTDLLDVAQAGLLLMNGLLGVAAASSEATGVVELLELENQGGPGTDAFRSGRPVHSGSLARAEARHRWPEFGECGPGGGIPGSHGCSDASPRPGAGGARPAEDLTDADLTVAQALADLATIAILQDRLSAGDRTVISQLRTALETRVVIEQAKESSHRRA